MDFQKNANNTETSIYKVLLHENMKNMNLALFGVLIQKTGILRFGPEIRLNLQKGLIWGVAQG